MLVCFTTHSAESREGRVQFPGKFVVAATAMFSLIVGGSAKADDQLTIKTDKGKIHGKKSDDGQVRTFLGVPYAAPPVGPLRWKPPLPAVKWAGARDATSFGSHC